ncbi:hypothetical protein GCK32_001887 [Trichostrongylus colubriformis]|uniref:Uncharacterized protein n=1 Tax=Trichostrongylus colubriformis TaxID=6319 RepID=A0AAN8J1S4_TRICO
MSYEQCDFQPGRRIHSFSALHKKADLTRPVEATAVASVFLEKDLRSSSTETCRLDDHGETLLTARLDPRSSIDSKEVPRIESKEVSRIVSKGVSRIESKEVSRIESKEVPRIEAKSKLGTATCQLSRIESKEVSRIESKEVPRIESKSKLGTATCQPTEKQEEKCIERKVQPSSRRRISNEILRKSVDTMNHGEGSIKTALSISTITKKEAGKYSFLHNNKSKPEPYVTNFEEPHPSDLDLDLCKEDDQKPEAPRLDMKKLEAFFNKPPTPPERKPRPAQSAGAAQSKPKSVTSRKSKSLRFLRALTTASTASSSERAEKTGELRKKLRTLRSKRFRNKPSRERSKEKRERSKK